MARASWLFVVLALVATACGGNEAVTDEVSSSAEATATASSEERSETEDTTSTVQAPTTSISEPAEPPESTTTTEPAESTTTTLPPSVPVVLPGFEETVVRTICVSVDHPYPAIDEADKPPLDGVVADALEEMGLVVVAGQNGCDATLAFDVEGQALGEEYSFGSGPATEYSGAANAGTAAFVVDGLEALRVELQGRLDPPFMVSDSRPTPSDAPFEAAFVEPLLTVMGEVWGPMAAIETIGMWPQADFFDTLATGGADWIVEVAPEVTPRLLELRLVPTFRIHERAYLGLAEIVARDAVPEADQSSVVRALVGDMDSAEHYAGEALRWIATAPFEGRAVTGPLPGYFEDGDGMILGPWDGPAWAEWADAQGY